MADKQHDDVEQKVARTHRRRELPRVVVVLASLVLGVLVLVLGLYAFYTIGYRERMFPNVTIGALAVGGLTKQEAKQQLTAHIDQFRREELPIQIGTGHEQFNLATVAATYNFDASIDRAFAVGRSGTLWNDALRQVSLVVVPSEVEPSVSYDSAALDSFLDTASTKYDVVEQNASFTYQEQVFAVVPARNGQRFNRTILKEHLERVLRSLSYPDQLAITLDQTTPTVLEPQVTALQPVILTMLRSPLSLTYKDFSQEVGTDQLADWLQISAAPAGATITGGLVKLELSKEKIQAYISTIAGNISQEPIDAKLTIVDGKANVFQQSRDGIVLDESASIEAIIKVVEQRRLNSQSSPVDGAQEQIELIVQTTKPTVSSDTIADLGIRELLGHGETDFSGSPNNRIHNITTGTKYLNGWLVKPGETFSTVKALGAVDASTGYLPELVIKENRTIPEYGGGLCQVSTTLFRSVLNAGLKVTERRNHSYRVSYYEREIGPGLDATVYLPMPEFLFLNDTPGWSLIQGEVKGSRLLFEIYGTKDGRTSKIEGPFILSKTAPPAAVYTTVDTMAPGEVKQIEKPHEGAKTTAKYTVMKDGKELFVQTFDSSYKALPARYLKGPDGAAPAEQPAEPAPVETPPAEVVQPVEEPAP
ncbi:MAG: VanW family protein [Patescibacteria group bacterium]